MATFPETGTFSTIGNAGGQWKHLAHHAGFFSEADVLSCRNDENGMPGIVIQQERLCTQSRQDRLHTA